MRGNRRTDTKPELYLRSALHARGMRFRKDFLIRPSHGRSVKVDITFTRPRVAVFVDGCFWHGCPEHGHTPKANSHYWYPKLKRNRERDERVDSALTRDGWKVVRIWEHTPLDEAVEIVVSAVAERG